MVFKSLWIYDHLRIRIDLDGSKHFEVDYLCI